MSYQYYADELRPWLVRKLVEVSSVVALAAEKWIQHGHQKENLMLSD